MKTKRKKNSPPCLLVLVPHRDTRLKAQKLSAELFASGYSGAWAFPWVSPLAVLSRPLSAEELKRAASAIREENQDNGGKITSGGYARAAFPLESKDIAVFGPALNLRVEDSAFSAIGSAVHFRFSPFVLGAAIVYGGETQAAHENALPAIPDISFRAAALANMIYRPLRQGEKSAGGEYSFSWRIGALCWLPPVRKKHTDKKLNGTIF